MLPSSEGSFEIKVKWKEYHVVSINTLRTVYLLEKYTCMCNYIQKYEEPLFVAVRNENFLSAEEDETVNDLKKGI